MHLERRASACKSSELDDIFFYSLEFTFYPLFSEALLVIKDGPQSNNLRVLAQNMIEFNLFASLNYWHNLAFLDVHRLKPRILDFAIHPALGLSIE